MMVLLLIALLMVGFPSAAGGRSLQQARDEVPSATMPVAREECDRLVAPFEMPSMYPRGTLDDLQGLRRVYIDIKRFEHDLATPRPSDPSEVWRQVSGEDLERLTSLLQKRVPEVQVVDRSYDAQIVLTIYEVVLRDSAGRRTATTTCRVRTQTSKDLEIEDFGLIDGTAAENAVMIVSAFRDLYARANRGSIRRP